jgi:hypothetical protein
MNTQRKPMTQFELSKQLLENLHKWNLSPTAKLVLMMLSSSYNPNKVDFYPAQQTIADKLGIGISSVKRAIKEMSLQGIVLYETKKFNRYKFTPKFFTTFNLIPGNVQNETLIGVKMDMKQITEKRSNNNNFSNNNTSSLNDYKQRRSYYNNQQSGQSYKSPEVTRAEIRDSLVRDDKTPMNDRTTALNYVSELIGMMDNPIIQMQVNKVKKQWDIC